MAYAVKEIYWTLQGEGANTGRAAVFCRFSGCNLWNGREQGRSKAVCQFCDTDFVGADGPGGGLFGTPEELADSVALVWTRHVDDRDNMTAGDVDKPCRNSGGADRFNGRRFVVCTGGEPLLQLDDRLIRALHDRGFLIAVETNGTISPPAGVDWLCVSPKANAKLVVGQGNELKLVYPQSGVSPENYIHLPFQHFFLQPLDGPQLQQNVARAVRYCLQHPEWRLCIQLHKALGFHETATITDAYRVAFKPWSGSNYDHDHHQSDRYLYETQDARTASGIDAVQPAQVAAGITSR